MKSQNESAVCVTCPPRGVVCREGRLQLTKKDWYPLGNQITAETEIHKCFNDESCIVYEYQSNSRIKCNVGMGYYGPLCGACNRKQNAIRSGNGCKFCWEDWQNFLISFVMATGWIGLIGYYSVFEDFDAPEGDYTSSAMKLLLSHLQMLGVLGIFKAKGTAVFNRVMARPSEIVGGSITTVLPLKCALNSQGYGTFLVNITLPWLVPIFASIFLLPAVLISRSRKSKRDAEPIPKFKGRFGMPRWFAKWRVTRIPMTAKDRKQWREPIDFLSRLVAIQIFMLFTMYPMLTASVASMLNCTDLIQGKRYLYADLSVTCFVGWHLVYVTLAVAAAILYCVGIPLLIYIAVAWKTPIICRQFEVVAVPLPDVPAVPGSPRRRVSAAMQRIARCKPGCRCRRRTPSDYSTASVRMRYGFLFNGYDVGRGQGKHRGGRSGLIVGWETMVMARKLFVTLAGATISDAYLQILAAQMILICAVTFQAYYQPYEDRLLNVLDTAGIFSLLCTQVMSILYVRLSPDIIKYHK